MPVDYGLCCVLGVFLIVLLGATAATVCARERDRPASLKEQQRLLHLLREGLLASPALSTRHPDAALVLRDWRLVPDDQTSRTDPKTKSIHMRVADPAGQPYDRVTLILVLLHELAHATDETPALAHDETWAQRQASYVASAIDDGLLLPGQEVDPAYPAQILPSS